MKQILRKNNYNSIIIINVKLTSVEKVHYKGINASEKSSKITMKSTKL